MSLANLLKYIDAVMLLLPLIDKIVTMVEDLFAKLGSGQGAAKKEAVIEVAKAALVGAGLDLPEEAMSEMIDRVVSIKNYTGEFISPAPRAPPDSTINPGY